MFLKKKRVEEQAIKTKFFRNIMKLIVWVLIAFVFYKGVMTIIKGDRTSAMEDDFLETAESQKLTELTRTEAISFAEDFAEEYMTFYLNNEEYNERLKEYSNLEFKIDQKNFMEVMYLNTTKYKWIDRDLIFVDCKVKVNYISNKKSSDTDGIYNNEFQKNNNDVNEDENNDDLKNSNLQTINLRIPVSIRKGKYIIESYPTFIGTREKASGDNNSSIPGEILENSKEKEKITNVISNFLSAYCEGNETDMEYFMLNQKNLNGLDSEFEVKNLIDENLVIKKYDDDYFVKVNYLLTDSKNEFMQSMEFELVYKDEKYLIKRFDTALNY